MRRGMRIGQVMMGAGALLCLRLAAYGQEAPEPSGQIRVSTDPEKAIIYCDGVRKDESPLTLTGIGPGDHLIRATKGGYREKRQTVTLVEGQKVAVEMKLEPLLGLLLVHSDPSGAEVKIGGADCGKTPLLLSNLALGKHRVHIAIPGYAAKDVDVDLPDRMPVKIKVKLASDSATLAVSSEPSGADVVVGGILKGKTPCTVERIAAGKSELEVRLAGYKPFKQSLSLAVGQEEKVEALLAPIPSELTVVTLPPKARVYVDDQFKGESPVTLSDLTSGTYRVRAELPGHEPMARTVEMGKSQKLTEEFRLSGNCGSLEITTEPSGVKVIVDGKDGGTTAAKAQETDRVSEPLKVDLLAEGKHQVQLVKKGFFDAALEVEVEREKAVVKHVAMKKRFIPDCEVRTSAKTYRGVLIEVSPAGDVKLELRPGVFETIPGSDIKLRIPIREEKGK